MDQPNLAAAEEAKTMGLSSMAWFFIAIVIAVVLVGIFDRPSKRNVFDPAIGKAVNAQVEAAEIRSGFTLTDEQAEKVREKAFLDEVRKSRYD